MRKIGVVTTTRADYGILSPLLQKIKENPQLELILYVSGSHLEAQHGMTVKEIEESGHAFHKIPLNLEGDTSQAWSQSLARAQVGFEKILRETKPDILIQLGDRVEQIPIALSAALLKIPIAHIHGGEVTEGAIDESVRHALTKFSHLHFTICEEYRERVIQMGENPDRVWNVGSLAVQVLKTQKFLSKEELEKKLNIKFSSKNILITLHPETLQDENYQHAMVSNLLNALEKLPQEVFLLFTGTNADVNGHKINQSIQEFVKARKNAAFVTSLGAMNYFSCLKFFNGVAGNSSSGIIEAPSFGIYTVNVGRRQEGRVRAKSVIDVSINESEIFSALNKVLSEKSPATDNPYAGENTVEKMIDVLEKVDLKSILIKKFFDQGHI